MRQLSGKLTYANVMSTLAVLLVISGGAAYAATHLPKNSVGSKQLKKNAVTTPKVKKEAITAAKVKKGTLTGTQINSSTLGTVPAAQTAHTATTLAAPEAWHEVGGPGEPAFQFGWKNRPSTETVAFYKDQGGVVHLRGWAIDGLTLEPIFQLPPGYRPSQSLSFAAPGEGTGVTQLLVNGSESSVPGTMYPYEGKQVSLDGITFRAES
jgi:hypothetical protein